MVIFSLLIAILIDRAMRARGHWQLQPISTTWHRYFHRFTAQQSWAQVPVVTPVLWILPALLLGLLVFLQGSALLTLIVNVLVLLVCLGCGPKRDLVRAYLAKAQHNRISECESFKRQLDAMHPELAGQSMGAHLVWLNFRYYFAVAFWFIAFGAVGALSYALLREFVVNHYADRGAQADAAETNIAEANSAETKSETKSETKDEAGAEQASDNTDHAAQVEQSQLFARILYTLEWPAARVAGFAYLLVGHFSRALPVWLKGLGNVTQPHHEYLVAIARRAEDGCDNETEMTEEPSAMLTLAKRSMMLLLAATALATLLGWLA